ncbi:Cbl proto-oncoprotein, E3 ubiquitin protein ligase-like 1, variant 2 [Schistosoma haematobium]|uniref:Cbl proto-oncoprotein, E3 ubiquitin protein ligase-like 1, variant 2 n=1 Tax=Schistosoma haematobium TaxID=6185 RepID=A0A922S129_SCHHA|nr:Cbl proto-oncoprotein, E3 ubiquitin protein ligase-like 1, variant 2 [Schistosoma haematobium]KAH9588504.1 Cbl proto-oncoprotein, E3 ubiquitin protein ligase-like 1, variant 2 [Schistosoma haematobium]
MPFPEPIPSYFDLQPSSGPSYQFRSVEDVNNIVQMLLWKVSQEQRYTGVGCIQEELFRHYPSAINFITSIRMNADCIPRLAEHKKLIQRVNTLLWAYATTRNVVTLADMEQLIQLEAPNDYRLLGPIVSLPAALEILQVSEFDQHIVACFTTGFTNQALKMCTEDVLEELKTCICKNRYRLPTTVSRGSVYSWWESVFTNHMLGVLDNVRVVQHSNQYQKLNQLAKYGIRIKGFSHLVQEITNNLRPENLNKAARLAQDQLDNDIRQLYKDFTSSLVSKSALKSYRSMKPVNVLKHLATCATQLHAELQNWAEERSLVWPKGHLDSLLVFGQFMQRIAATGPFRTLVHLLILLFNTESMNIKELLTRIVSSVRKADRVLESSSQPTAADDTELIDLTVNSDDELCEISTKLDDAITTKYPELTEIVDKFNDLLRQQQQHEEEGNVVNQSNNLWLSLASLEREIFPQVIGQNSPSLLSLLAEAINDGVNNVNLFPVNVTDIRKDKIRDENIYNESSPGKASVLHEESSTSRDIDPGLVFDFVQKLTCISSRSKEELCKLVCENLRIIHTSKLEQLIESILSQIMDDHEINKVKPLVYHHHVHLPNILTMEETQQSISLQSSSSDIISRLLTQRECVLSFLSACPSLMDLEAWSQWYQDCLFYDRWGSLDSFLIEAGAEQVCDQFNLLAIRILPFDGAVVGNNSQLLRLTAHPSSNDLKDALEKWRYNRDSLTIRLVGDYLIGSVIKASRLTISQACSIITNHFTTTTTTTTTNISKNVSDSNEWIYFVYSLLMKLPYSLLGLVFSLIIIPSLESAGIRYSTSWPLDKSDISLMNNNVSSINYSLLHIFFHDELLSLNTFIDENNSQLNRIYLISAIGSIGYQLKWPAYIKYFEENRFKLIDNPTTVTMMNIDQMKNIDMNCQLSTISILPSSLSETQFISENVDNNDSNQISTCSKLMENNEDIATNVSIQSNDVNTNASDICKSTIHLDKNMTIADSKNLSSDRHQFIEEIRRREFGVGVELSEEATDLIQRVEGKLSRSLVQLSEELYGLPGHFLLELIQNADDNTYGINDVPTLQLQLSTISTINNECNSNTNDQKFSLLVMNNESVGFTEHDMSALCDIGQSTKVTQRDAKIGRKGIGFKSVFNITDTPEVHSNGFHVRFHRQSKCTKYTSQTPPSLILIPEWCDNEQLMRSQDYSNEIPSWCKTLFILPLNSETLINRSTRIVQSPALYITQLVQTTLHPSLMLFLRRLQCLRFSSMESNIYWSVKRTIKTLSSSISGKTQYITEMITVHETQCNLSSDGETNTIYKWFCFKEIIPVDYKEPNKNLPSQTEISLAISLNDSDNLQPCPIFSYLPIRSVGFRFFINADFDLTSSREDVDSTSAWNRWLVGKIPNIFSDMIECIEKLPESCFTIDLDSSQSNDNLGYTRIELIGRIISCLPYNLSFSSSTAAGCLTNRSITSSSSSISTTITNDNVFFGLPNQLRAKLSNLAWLPGIQRTVDCLPNIDSCKYVIASRLLVVPTLLSSTSSSSMLIEKECSHSSEETNSITSSNHSELILLHLLIDYLQIYEPHPELLVFPSHHRRLSMKPVEVEDTVKDMTNDNEIIDKHQSTDYLIDRIRIDALHWLGAQTISVESLLNLATNLKPEDINRPGLLSVLMSSFDACLTTYNTPTSKWSSQISLSSKPSIAVSRRRLLTALQHLPIFPLTDGQCIRLNDKQKHVWSNDIHPVVLLPPCPSEIASMLIGITYDDYIQLIEKLGPLIEPDAFQSNQINYHKDYSTLLTDQSPIGLGLQIAYPSIVFTKWIIPYLKVKQSNDNFMNVSMIQMNWYITVAQFYTSIHFNKSHYQIENINEFSTILPIVVSNKFGENSILPALCDYYENGLQRDQPIILPPATFTIASSLCSSNGTMELSSSSSSSSVNMDRNFMEQLEVDLFTFLIEQINDSDCMYTVSPKYFQGFSTNPQQASRWYDLFSKAGVCTLLSVHKIKYFYQVSGTTLTSVKTSKHDVTSSSILKDAISLPINHRLQKSITDALHKQGLTLSIMNTPLINNSTIYLIEDYTSPGIDLLLTCIARLQGKLMGKEMAERLSCLLHDNWSSYSPVQSALFTRIKSQNDSLDKLDSSANDELPTTIITTNDTLHYLDYSSWLYKLRETVWLPIESTTLTTSSYQLMCPIDSRMIYSPSAFYQIQLQNTQLFKLLKDTCYIWSPGSYILSNPLNSQFTKSIGLINQPDRSTFEALMKCLGEKVRDNSIDSVHLTPDLMLFIYRTAVQYYLHDVVGDYSRTIDSSTEHSLIDWLRLVFANPTYPCILVQCPNTMITRKPMHKRPRSDTTTVNTDNIDLYESNVYKCPVCEAMSKSSTSMKTVPGKRRQRSNVDIDISGCSSDEVDQSTPAYHLVDIDVVCWESVVIDNHLLNSKYLNDNCSSGLGNNNSVHNTEDEEEDTVEYFNDQCILVNCIMSDGNEQPYIPVKTINRPRVFVLSKCYGSESRQFFIEKLGLPSTSTIDEVLALRPNLPIITHHNNDNTDYRTYSIYNKSLYEFNKKLSHWYSLLDYCLYEEYFTEYRLHNRTEINIYQNNKSINDNKQKTNQTTNNLINIDIELNKSTQLNYIKQFPIILDSFGQWHKPCDIVTLTSTSTNDDEDDNSDDTTNHQSNKLYLFAWSKPIHARLIHEMNWKQWNASKNNVDGNNVSFNPIFRIMAHSLNCLNARYTGSSLKMSPFSTKSVFTSTSFLLDQLTSSSSSSVQYYCREGTVHGLLLDLFSLPVIDHVSELSIKHHYHHQVNTINYYSNPTSSFKTDTFMIPCRALDMFLKGLMRLILLWWCSTIHSSSNTTNYHTNTSENSIDQTIVNGILESKEINAFLVDHLHIALSFNNTSLYSKILSNTGIDLSKRFIGCLLNGKLFLDSTLGANIFANLSQIQPDHGTQLIYLLLGSMNDPLLKHSIGFDSIDNSLLSQIIDFICPYGGLKKISLTQFIQGFINLALSIQTDITVFINQPHLNSTFLSQLENYLVSHGVKQRKAKHELHLLCPPLLPPSSTLTSKVVECYQNNQTTDSSVSSISTNSDDNIVLTSQSINNNQPLISVNSFEVIPSKSSTFTTTTNRQSTRYDTTLSAMQAISTGTTPFIRLSKETCQSIDQIHDKTTFWFNDENTVIPENLKTRLNRMLVNTTDKSTNIGRIGELYIYHTFIDYIHRIQIHHNNFDEMTSCEFPTGHPLLGIGRLIRCNWCNSDVESMKPYDFEVDVQVECDANKWDNLIENLKDEINNNIVRIIRRPSQQQDSTSSETSGLLSVGPIFIEVKSTMDSTNLHSNNSETNLNSGTDLFEFSLPEILCASQQGWRYHLLRVIWKNDYSQDFCQMRIASAPTVIHIPDLSNVLRQKSVNIRLCLALLRSEWIK